MGEIVSGPGRWFLEPLGTDQPWLLLAPARPAEPGRFVCNRCAAPLVPCDVCGRPAMCGDAWCEFCLPE